MNATDNISNAPTPEKRCNWAIIAIGMFFSGIALTFWHFAKKPILVGLRWILVSGGVFMGLLLAREDALPPAALILAIAMIIIGAIGVALIRRY